MTRQAWFAPVIGMVTAIAVGVGAAFIAVQFAPGAAVDAPPVLVEATVLEPVATDAALPEPAVDGEPVVPDGEVTPAPPRIVEVPDPAAASDPSAGAGDEPPAASAELEAAIDAAGASADPYFTLIDVLPTVPALFGDPCAINPDSDGCPAGVTGVVLGGDLPDLAARIEGGTCVTATGTTLAIAVRTNTPAEIVVTARSGDITVERTTATGPADAEGWTPDGPARVFWHCVATEGWPRGATVDVEAVVTDVLGRTLTVDRSRVVPVSAAAVRPDAQILGLSGNLIQVSTPFAGGQTVGVGWVAADAETCRFPQSGADVGVGVRELRPAAIAPIEPDYVADNNWLPEYDERSTSVFVVTPGESYRVCVGWFDGGAGDITGRPQYRNEVIVHAPATSFPTVTLTDVRLDVDVPAGGLSIRGAVPGARCGGYTGPGGTVPAVVCDLPAVSTAFDANGYITITTDLETSEGRATNHHVIEASAINCDGGCEARSEIFQVPIRSARPGLCGDCPTQRTLGWAELSATWPETTGRQWWQLGETTTGPITELDGERPNMEIATARWSLNPRYDPTTATQGARFPLTTDRPVTVVATLEGDCTRTSEPLVYRNDDLQQWSGAPIEFDELCMGSRYYARIQLTDEDGDVSLYAFERSDARFWPWAGFTTQRLTLDLPARVTLTAPAGEQWALTASQLSIGGGSGVRTGLSTPGVNVSRCFSSAGGTVVYRINAVTIGANNSLELRLGLRQGELTSEAVGPDGFRDCRSLSGPVDTEFTMTVPMTLDEIRSGALVTYTDPSSGIVVTLRPEPTLFR